MAYSYNCFPSIQFSQTGEILLLKHASLQIQKLQVHHDVKEIELYTNSFICSVDACGGNRVLSLVDSALLKINVWCRRQLDNYHAYFSKVSLRPLFAAVRPLGVDLNGVGLWASDGPTVVISVGQTTVGA